MQNPPGWSSSPGGAGFGARRKLTSERGRKLYAQRKISVEPVYGQIKYNRHIDRFMRRGRSAAQSEWRLSHRDAQPAEAAHPLDRQSHLTPGGVISQSAPWSTCRFLEPAPFSAPARIFRRPRDVALVGMAPDLLGRGRSDYADQQDVRFRARDRSERDSWMSQTAVYETGRAAKPLAGTLRVRNSCAESASDLWARE